LKKLKPARLSPGDKVATVSLSWGGAGDEEIIWRYQQGKKRLEEVFGLEVIEMPHALKGSDYVYNHPEKRAEDLMTAFQDPSIQAIVANIGGNDSIRMLPYIDFDVIRNNPKIFIGYSDSTITHMIAYKAGISTIYGPTLLVDFAENIEMHPYTIEHIKRTLFDNASIGEILPAPEWTSEYLPWIETNKNTARKYQANHGYELLQGQGIAKGHLIGGCFEVFDELRGTDLFPSLDAFSDAILFLETSEDKPNPITIECSLRIYGIMGILNRLNGVLWGKPQDQAYYEEYKEAIKKVLAEFNCQDLPVLFNMNFGHTEPKICLPYGAKAQIDCSTASFSILESGVK